MLIALLYHRSHLHRHGNTPEMLYQHLSYIKKRYPVVSLNQPLKPHRLHVLLTFDDATYDFYHNVYPMLQELGLPALLAVSSGTPLIKSQLSLDERLNLPSTLTFEPSEHFCTWEELSEMSKSGYVEIASHGHFHKDLSLPTTDLKQEIYMSRRHISKKLGVEPAAFVFPYGRFSKRAHAEVLKSYKYAIRIGNALNLGWKNPSKLLYRISCDQLPAFKYPFKRKKLLTSSLNLLSNSLRMK